MGRRSFSREFKLEAVRLVRERGVSVARAARDLDLHPNMLRKWVKDLASDPAHAFPGQGHMKPEQAEIERQSARLVRRSRARESNTLACLRLTCRTRDKNSAVVTPHDVER
jgi:transposase